MAWGRSKSNGKGTLGIRTSVSGLTTWMQVNSREQGTRRLQTHLTVDQIFDIVQQATHPATAARDETPLVTYSTIDRPDLTQDEVGRCPEREPYFNRDNGHQCQLPAGHDGVYHTYECDEYRTRWLSEDLIERRLRG